MNNVCGEICQSIMLTGECDQYHTSEEIQMAMEIFLESQQEIAIVVPREEEKKAPVKIL